MKKLVFGWFLISVVHLLPASAWAGLADSRFDVSSPKRPALVNCMGYLVTPQHMLVPESCVWDGETLLFTQAGKTFKRTVTSKWTENALSIIEWTSPIHRETIEVWPGPTVEKPEVEAPFEVATESKRYYGGDELAQGLSLTDYQAGCERLVGLKVRNTPPVEEMEWVSPHPDASPMWFTYTYSQFARITGKMADRIAELKRKAQ